MRDRGGTCSVPRWRELGFTGAPDLGRATAEHDEMVALLRAAGAESL